MIRTQKGGSIIPMVISILGSIYRSKTGRSLGDMTGRQPNKNEPHNSNDSFVIDYDSPAYKPCKPVSSSSENTLSYSEIYSLNEARNKVASEILAWGKIIEEKNEREKEREKKQNESLQNLFRKRNRHRKAWSILGIFIAGGWLVGTLIWINPWYRLTGGRPSRPSRPIRGSSNLVHRWDDWLYIGVTPVLVLLSVILIILWIRNTRNR